MKNGIELGASLFSLGYPFGQGTLDFLLLSGEDAMRSFKQEERTHEPATMPIGFSICLRFTCFIVSLALQISYLFRPNRDSASVPARLLPSLISGRIADPS